MNVYTAVGATLLGVLCYNAYKYTRNKSNSKAVAEKEEHDKKFNEVLNRTFANMGK